MSLPLAALLADLRAWDEVRVTGTDRGGHRHAGLRCLVAAAPGEAGLRLCPLDDDAVCRDCQVLCGRSLWFALAWIDDLLVVGQSGEAA